MSSIRNFPPFFNYRFGLFLLLLFGFSLMAQAQKNKVFFYELDVIKGLLFKPNTIDPFTGTAYDEFPNGKKKTNVPIKNGKIHGSVKEWTQNGKKIYEADYENGLQSGMERQWYANGNKKLEIAYTAGKTHGVCTEWFKNEQKKSEGRFVDGREEGEHQWWYDNGKMDELVFYKNGLTEGTVRSWHRNGQQRLVTEYKNGKKHGPSQEWYANGQLKEESSFVEGEPNGELHHWSPKGKLLSKRVYEQGTLVKDFNYRSGNIRKQSGYVQVFNEQESFFTLDIEGEEVLPRRNEVITYAVDGMLLQLFQRPVSELGGEEVMDLKEEDLLQKHLLTEVDYIRKMTEYDIQPQKNMGSTAAGKPYLFWSFVSPSSEAKEQKPRTVQRELYLSFVCNKRILSLYSVVTNSDEPEAVEEMLKRVAETLKVEKERIDLNAIVRNIQQGKR